MDTVDRQHPEVPTITYHLKVASHFELKKQPAKWDNKAQILKLLLTFPWVQMQDAILDKVAEVLKISMLTSTYHDFKVLFTVAHKISDHTPLQSNDDYEVLIENIEKMSNAAASIFVCALKSGNEQKKDKDKDKENAGGLSSSGSDDPSSYKTSDSNESYRE
ncbi:hypothetical protein L208DRAFT_1382079 [Tricholoma matsutake]|nr:hypothetical protein L208DRAFT_1382079 [Tricholoma matsutake 945]